MSLRALGNAGQLVSGQDTLQGCFTDGELPIDIRLDAIHAMHRLPCDPDRYDVSICKLHVMVLITL